MSALPLAKEQRVYATGSRKTSVAKVWLAPGKGNITVNGMDLKQYFQRTTLVLDILKPLVLTKRENKVDIVAQVMGGGKSGQAGALRHGIARALCIFEPELRPILKSHGFLTRDPRMVERKKYGLHKARKRYQYSKR